MWILRDALNGIRVESTGPLPPGYKEGMEFGMISWFVPLSACPRRLWQQQKGTPAAHQRGVKKELHGVAHDMFLRAAGVEKVVHRAIPRKKSGKKLDMGQGTLRFKGCRSSPWMKLRAPWPGFR